MKLRATVRRGARLGVLIGAWPAGIAGGLCLVTALVSLTVGHDGTAWALTSAGAFAVLGSMVVGVTVGTATGLALALAPRGLLTRPRCAACWRHSPPDCRWRPSGSPP